MTPRRVPAGRTVRLVVGCVVMLTDVLLFAYERAILQAPSTGWQELKDHGPYLVLAYLLIDWSRAWKIVQLFKDRLPGGKGD